VEGDPVGRPETDKCVYVIYYQSMWPQLRANDGRLLVPARLGYENRDGTQGWGSFDLVLDGIGEFPTWTSSAGPNQLLSVRDGAKEYRLRLEEIDKDQNGNLPNQAAQSSTTSVTPPAGQEARQP